MWNRLMRKIMMIIMTKNLKNKNKGLKDVEDSPTQWFREKTVLQNRG
jgi:hypothetical protein